MYDNEPIIFALSHARRAIDRVRCRPKTIGLCFVETIPSVGRVLSHSRDKRASYRGRQIFVGLTGFRLAGYRGVGVGCEAPYLRSIFQKFLDEFFTLLRISMHLHIQPFKVGLCHGIQYPVSPLLSRMRVCDETRQTSNIHNSPLLSEHSESQEIWESSR